MKDVNNQRMILLLSIYLTLHWAPEGTPWLTNRSKPLAPSSSIFLSLIFYPGLACGVKHARKPPSGIHNIVVSDSKQVDGSSLQSKEPRAFDLILNIYLRHFIFFSHSILELCYYYRNNSRLVARSNIDRLFLFLINLCHFHSTYIILKIK